MSLRRAAPRDGQRASPFAVILEGFWRAHPSVLAAVFVDDEGECVDYFSSLEPFEAKVAGAHLVALRSLLREPLERLGAGCPRLWLIEAERRDLVLARASDEYAVALVLTPRGVTARMLEAIESLIEALAREAGFQAGNRLRVEVEIAPEPRDPVPRALWWDGRRVPVSQLLACWSERGAVSEGRLRCYRVLTEQGERTLVYDPALGSWHLRPSRRDSDAPGGPPGPA